MGVSRTDADVRDANDDPVRAGWRQLLLTEGHSALTVDVGVAARGGEWGESVISHVLGLGARTDDQQPIGRAVGPAGR